MSESNFIAFLLAYFLSQSLQIPILCTGCACQFIIKENDDDDEIVTVEQLRYCLPFILYASEAVTISAINCWRLDNCISRDVYKIFAINSNDNLWQLRRVWYSLPFKRWLRTEDENLLIIFCMTTDIPL